MFDAYMTADTSVYWIVAGILALGLVGVKLVMMNFDRKHRDKK